MKETYGVKLPGLALHDLVGKLIVIEGTDGVGRSTQIHLLKEWLEQQGRAVIETGMTREDQVEVLAPPELREAVAGAVRGATERYA